MRGKCTIIVNLATRETCDRPSVYSQPCQCDECDDLAGDGLPPVHEDSHWCAEHYDEITAPSVVQDREQSEDEL